LISQGVPVVGCTEIPWAVQPWCADPTNSSDIADKLKSAYTWSWVNVKTNQISLTKYTNTTAKIWDQILKG